MAINSNIRKKHSQDFGPENRGLGLCYRVGLYRELYGISIKLQAYILGFPKVQMLHHQLQLNKNLLNCSDLTKTSTS